MTFRPCRMHPITKVVVKRLHGLVGIAALALAGCSTLDASAPSSSGMKLASIEDRHAGTSLPTPSGPSRPSVTGVEPQLNALPSVAPVRAPSTDAESDAIGTPTDPLSSDKPVNLEDVSAKRDLWERMRKGFVLRDLDTDLVHEHERWYASRPDYVQRMTERSSRYLFHIVEEVQRRGMPSELALLPFIESAFNPGAMSSAKASGMWQFIPSTGRTFSLKQNIFRDDRRDVLASTQAALDYLQKLHGMFGDWHLALAAYNWGEGNVQRAISRNQRAGLPTDYLSLNMPAETRHYVPKLQAVKNIVSRPDTFGLSLPPIENHPYFVAVSVKRDIDVKLAARLAGLTDTEFHDLNPSQNKPVVLAAGTPQILLPYDNAERFVANLQTHVGPLASWTAWSVPRTLRPSEAARLVGMSEGSLRELNHVPPKMLIKAGSTLLIPRSGQGQQDVTEAVADNATMQLAPDSPPMKKVFIRAHKRDTVASLARRYRVSPSQLAQWNRLSESSSLVSGQRVAIYQPIRSTAYRHPVRNAGATPLRSTAPGRKVALVAKASRPRGSAPRVRSRNAGSRVASVSSRIGAR